MVINQVFTRDDFDNLLNNYFGRRVSHTPVTKTTSNITGEETLADGSAVNIMVHFVLTNDVHEYDKSGLTEKGDAIMVSRIADGVVKNDKITVDGRTYRVKEAHDYSGTFEGQGAGTETSYTVCSCFLES